jgi:hypothetical protein
MSFFAHRRRATLIAALKQAEASKPPVQAAVESATETPPEASKPPVQAAVESATETPPEASKPPVQAGKAKGK